MVGVWPPNHLLSNHPAFVEFKVATRAIFPHGANYLATIDGCIGREWLLRQVWGLYRHTFTHSFWTTANT